MLFFPRVSAFFFFCIIRASNSYFSQHTPIFPIFKAISFYFSYFLAILHVTCISYISFQGFLFNFLFFLIGAHQLLKIPNLTSFGIILYTYNFIELFRLLYLAFGRLGWLYGCRETMLRYRKYKIYIKL